MTTPSPDEIATNGTLAPNPNPNVQVPLDTIPISPAADESTATKMNDENADPNAVNGNKPEEKEKPDPSKPVTVFDDPDNFTVKHPLMNKWTLWFTKPPSGKGDNWNELLKEVVTFDSVEEFWGIYNNITPVSELALKSDYHLFKQGVRPEWEDVANKHGGRWAYGFKDKKTVPIDELWLHVMLAAIGETLENEDDREVMGVVVNVRKGFYRIGLWTRTVGKGGEGRTAEKGREALMGIGRRFKEVLKLRESEQVEFSGHTESAQSGSSRAKAKFVV